MIFGTICTVAIICWLTLPFCPSLLIKDLQTEHDSLNRGIAYTVSATVTNTGNSTVYFRCSGDTSYAFSLNARVALHESDIDHDEFWLPSLQLHLFGRPIEPEMNWRSLAPGHSILLNNRFVGTVHVGTEIVNEMRVELSPVDWRGRTAIVCSESFDLYALPDTTETPGKLQLPK